MIRESGIVFGELVPETPGAASGAGLIFGVSGGGQPFAAAGEKAARARSLYDRDIRAPCRASEANPAVRALYETGVLKGGAAHELLHRQ